eukprot:c13041_g1_i1.p1 GENE.c13041_g1_i1~~c13041_g1_i1.p1  ORF type:complete len:326 (-),score=51.79 c13041_g1_i1:190-1167(-)
MMSAFLAQSSDGHDSTEFQVHHQPFTTGQFGARKYGSVSDLVGMTAPLNISCPTSMFERIAIENPEKRITIWNRTERRKISGNAAPMGKNLIAYLNKHPHCEVYEAQDKAQSMGFFPTFSGSESESSNGFSLLGCGEPNSLAVSSSSVCSVPEITEKRVTIWHKEERRKISGNAAPMEKNLLSYLNTHPNCEKYVDQDKTDHTKPEPVPEHPSESQSAYDETHLTPIESFDLFDGVHKSMAIPSPQFPMVSSHTFAASMSPVDSLASSLGVIDFSLGSQHQIPKRMRTCNSRECVVDESDRLERGSVSDRSEPDDLGVLGELEGV